MSPATSPVVDAHHHLWDPATADLPWLSGPYAPIRRRFDVEDLAPLVAAAGVGSTIVVQTQSSLAETRELLATAAASSFIAGVIGWVDLTDPGVGRLLAELLATAAGNRLVGVRHQVQDEPDPGWLLRPEVRRGLAAVAEAGLVYDLLVRPRELPAALAVAAEMPELRFVLDHLAKPPIAAGALEPWATLLARFGPLEHVAVKVSGLVTEADWQAWTVDDLSRYFDEALQVFGPDRLLFGSDWPVCLVAASYEEVIGAARSLTAELTAAERDAIFGATAARIYRLG